MSARCCTARRSRIRRCAALQASPAASNRRIRRCWPIIELTAGTTLDKVPAEPAEEPADDEESPPPPPVPARLEAGFAELLEVRPGDELTVLLRRGPTKVRVAGILKVRKLAATLRQGDLFLRLADLQELSNWNGLVDTAYLTAAWQSDVQAAQAEVRAALRPRCACARQARKRNRRILPARGTSGADVAQTLAVIVAGFIILNTLLISVGQRRRSWSMLRAIGATHAQILRIVLTEGVICGVVGSVGGLLLGIVGARLLAAALSGLLERP